MSNSLRFIPCIEHPALVNERLRWDIGVTDVSITAAYCTNGISSVAERLLFEAKHLPHDETAVRIALAQNASVCVNLGRDGTFGATRQKSTSWCLKRSQCISTRRVPSVGLLRPKARQAE